MASPEKGDLSDTALTLLDPIGSPPSLQILGWLEQRSLRTERYQD
jgi:hypothetical protein